MFLAGTASGGYIVTALYHSSNYGISPPSSTGPTPVMHAAHAPILHGHHMPIVPTPTTHVSNPCTVLPPIHASVMSVVAPANHAPLPPSTFHFPQPDTAFPASPVNSMGMDRLEELSEVASHLNIRSGKHKGGHAKNSASTLAKNASPAQTKNAAPTQSHYPTQVHNG